MKRRRAEIEYEDGSVYEGEIDADGNRDGTGTFRTVVNSYVVGDWRQDVLVEGREERDEEGNEFRGSFDWRGNKRGALRMACGSRVEGSWVEGELQGEARFTFPDGRHFAGVWRAGRLEGGDFEGQFMQDEGPFPGKHPLMADPYEACYVNVRPSTIPGAGEGLFSLCTIPADLVFCYYNGSKIAQTTVDSRMLSENGNVVLLDDSDICIDVPVPYDSRTHYCATSGHKANHDAKRRNAVYINAFHPRFGHISALKSLRVIEPDEEILLDYEYAEAKPEWYRD